MAAASVSAFVGSVNSKQVPTPSGLSLIRDRAAMARDDPLDDREPETGARVVVRGQSLEPVEDPFALLGRDADAVVADHHLHPVVVHLLGLDQDPRDGSGVDVLEGVAIRLSSTWRRSTRSAQTSKSSPATISPPSCGTVAGVDDVLDHVAQRDLLAAEHLVAGDSVGEQVADEAAHLLDARPDVLDHRRRRECVVLVAVGQVLLERLGPSVDHAERVVQVVGDGAGERHERLPVGGGRGGVANQDHRAHGSVHGVRHREGPALEPARDAELVDVVVLLALDVLTHERAREGVLRLLQRSSVGMEGLTRVLLRVPDTVEGLVGSGPKAVRSALLLCRIRPPSSMMATPSSRCAITRSSSSARTARTASDRSRSLMVSKNC